jgi:hypothetical protein
VVTLLLSEIFPGKLSLMPDIGAWVQIACPRYHNMLNDKCLFCSVADPDNFDVDPDNFDADPDIFKRNRIRPLKKTNFVQTFCNNKFMLKIWFSKLIYDLESMHTWISMYTGTQYRYFFKPKKVIFVSNL